MGIFAAAAALFGKGESQDADRQSRGPRPVATTESKPTVLVIDDDPSFLAAIRRGRYPRGVARFQHAPFQRRRYPPVFAQVEPGYESVGDFRSETRRVAGGIPRTNRSVPAQTIQQLRSIEDARRSSAIQSR